MKKFQGKRFVVFGRRLDGEYYIEQDSIRKARVEAWLHLQDGYDAHILDQKTDKVVEVKVKK